MIAYFNFSKLKINKDTLYKNFIKNKIVAHYHYIPNTNFKFYKSKNLLKFKGALNHFKNAISLPIHYKLSLTELQKIEKKIKLVVDQYTL